MPIEWENYDIQTLGGGSGKFRNSPTTEARNTLKSLFENFGYVDPRQRIANQQYLGRRGASTKQAIGGGFAARGLGNSNLLDTINASIDAGTARGIAGEQLKENQLSEARQAQDLGLLADLVINPFLENKELDTQAGIYGQRYSDAKSDASRQRRMQTIGTILSIAALFCWVARAVLGPDNPDWLYARHYMLHMADPDLTRLYAKEGPALAERVQRDPALKDRLRPVFDHVVAEAKRDLQENS